MLTNINLTNKNLSFHIVGIFGIGMSALAQCLKWNGFHVSGSDRAVKFSENEQLYKTLSRLEIKLYDQDGSYIKEYVPDYIVYSTAIEEDNPDFIVSSNIPRLHRTELLVKLFEENEDKTSIAVTGTCGKTTVSSLLADTFAKLDLDPFAIVGGFVNSFISEKNLGNFRYGSGDWMIFESDESDKSLLRFYPDYSILLNVGTDHYSKEELIIVFEKFLLNTKKGAVIEKELCRLLNPKAYEHLKVVLFSTDGNIDSNENMWYFDNYTVNSRVSSPLLPSKEDVPENNGISVDFRKGNICKHFTMPVPGRYNAGNFLAAYALYELLGLGNTSGGACTSSTCQTNRTLNVNEDEFLASMSTFKGVHRRFEYVGITSGKTDVYCDFAHNVNKIESAVKCAKELTEGRVFAIFQPHGYKPLRFMREELFPAIENSLDVDDRFILMPVYYSGGTCIADPKVEDVIKKCSLMSKEPEKFMTFSSRCFAEEYLKTEIQPGDVILVMGARDNTLPIWSKELVNIL